MQVLMPTGMIPSGFLEGSPSYSRETSESLTRPARRAVACLGVSDDSIGRWDGYMDTLDTWVRVADG